MKKTLLLAGVAALVATSANAADLKPYVGLDYVYSDANYDFDGDDFWENKLHSLNVNAGTKLNKNFGIEAFYQQSGDEKGDLVQNMTTGIQGKTKASFDAYGADITGYVPVAQNTEVFGALGLGMYDAEIKAPGLKESDDGLGVRIGAGVMYNFNEHFAVRGLLRYVNTDIDGLDDLTEFSAGVRYTF